MLSYIRTPRAAVAATAPAGNPIPRPRNPIPGPTQTLWASRPKNVRAGRLVAVRLMGTELRVGLVTSDGLRWVRPEGVITSAQAESWASSSTFAPDSCRRR